MTMKQTEIGRIHSLANFKYIFLLPTQTVIVAHAVYRYLRQKHKHQYLTLFILLFPFTSRLTHSVHFSVLSLLSWNWQILKTFRSFLKTIKIFITLSVLTKYNKATLHINFPMCNTTITEQINPQNINEIWKRNETWRSLQNHSRITKRFSENIVNQLIIIINRMCLMEWIIHEHQALSVCTIRSTPQHPKTKSGLGKNERKQLCVSRPTEVLVFTVFEQVLIELT
jgi:hypothetical protein